MEETTFVTFESFSNNIFFHYKNEIFVSLAIIRRYCPDLSEDDLEKILIKYDIKETGRFCYNDFLRYFVLTMKSHEGSSSSLLARKRLESPKIQVGRRLYHACFCGIDYWQEYPNIKLIYTVLLVAKYEHHLKQESIAVRCMPSLQWPLGVCPRGVPGGVYEVLRQTHTPPVDRILDTRLWKYYLAATSLRTE